MNRLVHIPEGFRDIYRSENRNREIILNRITDLLSNYGYEGIETPAVEYFDVFGSNIGTTPSRELYKFFDRDGNTIVLRPDFTPSVARAAATYFNEENRPLRLFYHGNVYQNNVLNQGRLRESAQIGAEFIGDGSLDADAEILSMVVKILEVSGIHDFQLSLSHSDLFDTLMDEAGFEDEEEQEIRTLIENHNFFGLEETLEQKAISDELKSLFGLLGPQHAPIENWDELLNQTKNYPRLQNDLQYLKDLYDVLCLYGVEKHISFDLGQISSFRYYTGIIFTGYTYGTGEPVVKGGRYDKLLQNFGKQAPAIGFAFTLDQIMMALDRQGIRVQDEKERHVLLYMKESRKQAILRAEELRSEGIACEMILCNSPSETEKKLTSEYTGVIFEQMEG